MTKPELVELFADNGEHSHWALINKNTGAVMWSESIEEDAIASMDKSIRCLALELPSVVWDDVNARWQRVKRSITS